MEKMMAWLRAVACGKLHLQSSKGRQQQDVCCEFQTHHNQWLLILRKYLYPESFQSRPAEERAHSKRQSCRHSQTLTYNRPHFSNCKDNRYKRPLPALRAEAGKQRQLVFTENSKKEKVFTFGSGALSLQRAAKCAQHIKYSSVQKLCGLYGGQACFDTASFFFFSTSNSTANILWWVFGFICAGNSMSEPQASICTESTADEKQFEGATLWFDPQGRLKMFYRHFFL